MKKLLLLTLLTSSVSAVDLPMFQLDEFFPFQIQETFISPDSDQAVGFICFRGDIDKKPTDYKEKEPTHMKKPHQFHEGRHSEKIRENYISPEMRERFAAERTQLDKQEERGRFHKDFCHEMMDSDNHHNFYETRRMPHHRLDHKMLSKHDRPNRYDHRSDRHDNLYNELRAQNHMLKHIIRMLEKMLEFKEGDYSHPHHFIPDREHHHGF
ncbi:MAG: hypothetical protein IJ730_02195 [Alphaproteobacteria bacterium]|nr:hypothetical protein [Alphaproteobacteria bacterium]